MAECSTVMDQRQRNFESWSQQFWSSVLPGHLDLPTVGGDVLTLPKLEISLTRGTGRQAGYIVTHQLLLLLLSNEHHWHSFSRGGTLVEMTKLLTATTNTLHMSSSANFQDMRAKSRQIPRDFQRDLFSTQHNQPTAGEHLWCGL